jgi:L-ascorbate metabolism protein UlaG (beta-lactamase superfamily)
MTYLGVAGWQIECAGKTILVDPYFSRPALNGAIESDPQAIAAHAPKKADLILVGHSHVDHLLDTPGVAIATGAEVMGSASTTAVAKARNVSSDHLITVQGGEDCQFDGFSVRVIPSLHSALDHKHGTPRPIPISVMPPVRFDDYEADQTFEYLLRIGGHEIFISDTANFIERELVGMHPDVAIVATGLRQEIHDYTGRLMQLLHEPTTVFATHFDDWKSPPTDPPPSDPLDEDLAAFVREVGRSAPATHVIIPRHFVANQL